MVTNIEKAIQLWTALHGMKYTDLPSMLATAKGIAIGPEAGSDVDIPENGEISQCLQSYWVTKGLLTFSNIHLFKDRIQKIRGVGVDGVHYRKK